MSNFSRVPAVVLLVFSFLSLVTAAHAADNEVRVDGTCGSGASSELRLRADDGSIRVRFEVDSTQSHSNWQVTIVHEGRIAWRGGTRSDGGGSLEVRRRLRDLGGADQITARALGPHGVTCIAAGTLPG